ncbi:MAG TPA: ABC transporter ATP-binding protein [Azospirillum sp.]|nr:ABC transporter ATP-binding protein [Azospirillum sp.]
MANVTIENVCKRFGARTVLDGLSLAVDDGECFTLLGPSGCGKSVLMRLIAGFEAPESGTIAIGGRAVADPARGILVPPDRRGLGMVFQDYAVWPHMTVAENVAYPLKIAGTEAAARAEATRRAVAMVGLAGLEERLPSQLSGGQQQRVALARALVSEPRLLVLDEPLNNLDANLREEMRFEIKALQRTLGITVLYVTHDQEIALGIADRLAVMDGQGHLRQIGTPEEIYERPADAFVFRFMGIANFLPVRRQGDGWVAGEAGVPWTGPPPQRPDALLAAGFRPSDVTLAREGVGMPATVRRASFLGASVDYLIEIGGTLVRAALPSHDCLSRGLLFAEGEACRVALDGVQWFAGGALEGGAA